RLLAGGSRSFHAASLLLPRRIAAPATALYAFCRVADDEIDLGGGRSLHVPKSLKGVAVFSWRKLIDAPHSAADYLAVARRYHTVFLVGVPILGPENRNAAMRFVAFVDAMYEYGVKLVMAADAPPDALYTAGDGAFEFQRTASRLEEMRSESWMARGHGLAA
ncbi:MAG: AFG1/ZapE family ATPase, partial [Thermaurantiacus sp.]